MFTDLIYDFDGTISDTYPIFTEALLQTLQNHGLSDSYEQAYKKLKVSVGFALGSYDWNQPIKLISKEFHDVHEALALEKQEAIEGAADILRFAVDHGMKNYLYTHTGKIVYKLLDKMGIHDYFTEIMDGSLRFERKPCPDALNWLIDKRKINRSGALMIGDREMDIGAAHNADIKGCLFDLGDFFPQSKADYKIFKLTELKDIILNT